MKNLTLKSGRVKIDGHEAGYYAKIYSGQWYAEFKHDGMVYVRTATKKNELRTLCEMAIYYED